jgi:hypothetical protein
MALIAQLVDIGDIQQPGVLRAVRSMAGYATFTLDRSMFEHEGATGFRVALGADCILIGGGLEVVVPEGAVGVVAVGALDQAFIYPMMKGHIEGWLHVCVAGKAELRLRHLQQGRVGCGVMHAMAAEAANICLGVRRAEEIGVGSCMAAETGGVDLFGAGFAELDDLGNVTARFNVRATWSMAAFAGDAFSVVLQGELGVGIVVKLLRDVSVAGFTRLGAYQICRVNSSFVGGRRRKGRRWCCWRRCGSRIKIGCATEAGHRRQYSDPKKPLPHFRPPQKVLNRSNSYV